VLKKDKVNFNNLSKTGEINFPMKNVMLTFQAEIHLIVSHPKDWNSKAFSKTKLHFI
jgi:hypothetical protein